MVAPDMEAALLKWINTFSLDITVKSLDDFMNGAVLGKVLADIDPMYAANESITLEEIIDALAQYIRRECPSLIPLVESQAIKSLGAHASSKQLMELLQLFLMVAVMGPQRGRYVPAITGLDSGTQGAIARVIQKKEQELQEEANNVDLAPPNDAELEFEQRYGELLAQKQKADRENEQMKKTMADLNTRLETLTINHDKLQSFLAETQDTLARSRDEDSAAIIKSKQIKIQEQDELIESQEQSLEQFRQEKQQMRKTIEKLKSADERAVQLEDEVQMLKHENLELAKKANTVDRYKQKLETQKVFEKQNKDLTTELAEIKEQMRKYEGLEARNHLLESTHKKYQEINDKYELDLIDMISQKDHLKNEVSRLEESVARLRADKQNDERIILDLQEQSNGSAARGSGGLDLGAELEQSELGDSTRLENSRLKAENELLKDNKSASEESKRLLVDLEDAKRIQTHLESKYNMLFEEHVITKEQLLAVLNNSIAEGKEAFVNLRNQHMQASKDLAATKAKLEDLESEMEARKRDLVDAKADLSAVAKAEIEALTELKSAQESITASLQKELIKVKGRNKILQAECDNSKTQLTEAILAKDKLSKNIDAVEEAVKDKQTIEGQLTATKAELAQLKEELRAQQSKASSQGEQPTAESIRSSQETDTLLQNLRRENALIASAWYDLSSRLQSNNVILQRRADVPRSWLNKQRHMMQTTPRR